MGRFQDLTGKKFNRLTVICRVENYIKPSGGTVVMYKCKCDCGNFTTRQAGELKSGYAVSCGCAKNEYWNKHFKAYITKHGKCGTRIYRIYRDMVKRCSNPNHKYYSRYGGRGIFVCDEWKDDFTQFEKWAYENGYADNLTIDRVDNDGNYTPSNCRWITQKRQMNNTSTNRYITHNGETHSVAEWSEILGIKAGTIAARDRSGKYSSSEILGVANLKSKSKKVSVR